MGIIRGGDSAEYSSKSDDYGKYFSEKSRKIVKLEKWKSIVIVAGEDLEEIRPLLTLPRNGEIPKWGSSEVAILEILSQKVMIMGNAFRKSPVKS